MRILDLLATSPERGEVDETQDRAAATRRRPIPDPEWRCRDYAETVAGPEATAVARAPWGEDAALRAAVRRLREQGEAVVCVLPETVARTFD